VVWGGGGVCSNQENRGGKSIFLFTLLGSPWQASPAAGIACSARSGGDCSKVSKAIQKKSRPSPRKSASPFSCKLLSEQGFGLRKANAAGCRVFASHFPSDEVQDEAKVRKNTPASANDWGKNTAAVVVFVEFDLY